MPVIEQQLSSQVPLKSSRPQRTSFNLNFRCNKQNKYYEIIPTEPSASPASGSVWNARQHQHFERVAGDEAVVRQRPPHSRSERWKGRREVGRTAVRNCHRHLEEGTMAPLFFFNTIFVSSHMYPENPKGTQVIVGSMNMGYDKYPTLPGIKLTTCSVPSARRFH